MKTDSHNHEADFNKLNQNLVFSIGLNLLTVVLEFVGGFISGSLSLLSDAMHNLTDVVALVITYIARKISRCPPSLNHTYGLRRIEIIAALVNSIILLVVITLIIHESVIRLFHPHKIQIGIMLGIGLIGLFANLFSVLLLKNHSHGDLNVRSAFLHLMQDTLSSGIVVIAALLSKTSWGIYLDPLASMIIALLVVYGGWDILRRATHVLMEGTPLGLDLESLQQDIHEQFPEVSLHHIHVWEISSGNHILTAHAMVPDMSLYEAENLIRKIHQRLTEKWKIHHATIEIELQGCGKTSLLGQALDSHE